MKRALFIISLLGAGLLVGCSADEGTRGLTIQEPIPLSEDFPDSFEVIFSAEQLNCFGIAPGPNGDGRFTCDWESLENPTELEFVAEENPHMGFAYYQSGADIVPCVIYEGRDTQWLSCGFGVMNYRRN